MRACVVVILLVGAVQAADWQTTGEKSAIGLMAEKFLAFAPDALIGPAKR